MFDKKIILLISFLLITSSSYIIFHRKKNNNDEVNIVDNSDNSINDDVSEEGSINENTESSSSFLFVVIIIVVIIIIVAAIFFFIFYRKNKKGSEEIETENKEKELSELEGDEEYSKEFIKYIKHKNESIKLKIIADKYAAEDLIDKIINKMKQDYDNYINDKNLNPENYEKDNYLIDFYFKPDLKDKDTMEINVEDNKSKKLIFKNKNKNKRVREISIEKNKEIICNLFAIIFKKIKDYGLFSDVKDAAYNVNNNEECEEKINSFFFSIIDPFLECVSERENKDIRFISEPNKICNDFKEVLGYLSNKEDENDPESMKVFIDDLRNNRLNYFVKIFNDLINYHFPESKYLNKIKYKI